MKPSPQIVPVSQLLAPDCRDAGGRAMPGAIAEDRCVWTPGWTETNSRSYWLREAQVQAYLNKPAAGILVQYAGQ